MSEDKVVEIMSLSDFLVGVPPNTSQLVMENGRRLHTGQGSVRNTIALPRLYMHCGHPDCSGERYFDPTQKTLEIYDEYGSEFIDFRCSNCAETVKRYSLFVSKIQRNGEDQELEFVCEKYGEVPNFGVPTPTRLLRLLGSDRELFLKGRRCETQGLGVGAFAYYRRAVENRKNDLFDEVLKVARQVGSSADIIEKLENAKKQTQFSKALSNVKEAIPESLKIMGQNPLALLHTALSDGLHGRSDDECLSTAHDIRVLLVELAQRISEALKDEQELNMAVSRLSKAASNRQK